jgi:hypothetical protein
MSAALFGFAIGSFSTCASTRYPEGQSIVTADRTAMLQSEIPQHRPDIGAQLLALRALRDAARSSPQGWCWWRPQRAHLRPLVLAYGVSATSFYAVYAAILQGVRHRPRTGLILNKVVFPSLAFSCSRPRHAPRRGWARCSLIRCSAPRPAPRAASPIVPRASWREAHGWGDVKFAVFMGALPGSVVVRGVVLRRDIGAIIAVVLLVSARRAGSRYPIRAFLALGRWPPAWGPQMLSGVGLM